MMEDTLHFVRLCRHLHTLGPRPMGEFLKEIAREHGLDGEIIGRLEDYARLSPSTVIALGVTDFPQPPIRAVG